MKNMKRIIALLMATTMIFSLVACGDTEKTPNDDTSVESSENTNGDEVSVGDVDVSDEPVELTSAEQVLIDLYDQSPIEFPVMTWMIDITDPALVKSYTGLENGDKLATAVISEPAMSSQAYSVVLVELKDEADAEAVAEEMKNGVDPEKWEDVVADDMDVVIEGKYVCLVMISSDYADKATAKDLTALVVDILTGDDEVVDDTTNEGTETE